MSNLSSRVIRFVGFFVLVAGFTLGCQKKEDPHPIPGAPPGPGQSNPGNPLAGLGKTPDNEDPEVLAYLKGKGWSLSTIVRPSDGKRLVYLSVEDKNKPFADVSITHNDYKMIAKSKSVQALDLRNVSATDEGLKAVAGIPQMESIVVQCQDVTDAGLKALAQNKSLDNVMLTSAKKVTDAGVKELAALPKLQTLWLMIITLDGSAFEAFAESKTLTSLRLQFVDGLTDAGAKQIAKIPNLDELVIKDCVGEQQLTAVGIKAIATTRMPAKFEFDNRLIDDDLLALLVAKGWLHGPTRPNAREKRPATPADVQLISLGDSKITDKGLDAILGFTNAKNLNLSNTGISDEGLKKLAGFKKLEVVSLSETKVTGVGLEAIAGPRVRDIALWDCALTEDAFKAIGKMSALEHLDLWGAELNPEWLTHIGGLANLKWIKLKNTAFDDAAAKHLTSLPELRDLYLEQTSLTDAGLQELLKLPKLERLVLDGTKVTKEAYQKAKKDRPKLQFLADAPFTFSVR